jgi:hypothetical protein
VPTRSGITLSPTEPPSRSKEFGSIVAVEEFYLFTGSDEMLQDLSDMLGRLRIHRIETDPIGSFVIEHNSGAFVTDP